MVWVLVKESRMEENKGKQAVFGVKIFVFGVERSVFERGKNYANWQERSNMSIGKAEGRCPKGVDRHAVRNGGQGLLNP